MPRPSSGADVGIAALYKTAGYRGNSAPQVPKGSPRSKHAKKFLGDEIVQLKAERDPSSPENRMTSARFRECIRRKVS